MNAKDAYTLLRIARMQVSTTPEGKLVVEPTTKPITDDLRNAIRSCRDDLFAVVRQEEEMIEAAETVPGKPCERCGATKHTHTVLWGEHEGRSVSRECASCRRTLCLPVWYGEIGERPASEKGAPAASLAADMIEPPAESLRTAEPSLAEIEQALAVIVPDGVAELRTVGTGGRDKRIDVGYFDVEHRRDMARAALQATRDGAICVYVAMNACRAEVHHRAFNRMKKFASVSLHNNEVASRRWFFVDVDHHRAKGISSSHEEMRKAFRVGSLVRQYLRANGWPEPIIAASGNGMHLLYRIDQPNDKPTQDLIRKCLNALAQKFDDGAVQIGDECHNAARHSKVWGTLVRKGDSTPERPHRMSRLVHLPDSIDVVHFDRLAELAEKFERPKAKESRKPGRRLARMDVLQRAAAYLETCDVSMQGDKGSDRAIYAAIKLVHGFGLKPETALHIMVNSAWNQRCDPPWTPRELEHKCKSADQASSDKPRGYLLGQEAGQR